MALIGLGIASVANMFLASSALDWVITYASILIFMGLTVYDTKRIKTMTYALAAQGDTQGIEKYNTCSSWNYMIRFGEKGNNL